MRRLTLGQRQGNDHEAWAGLLGAVVYICETLPPRDHSLLLRQVALQMLADQT